MKHIRLKQNAEYLAPAPKIWRDYAYSAHKFIPLYLSFRSSLQALWKGKSVKLKKKSRPIRSNKCFIPNLIPFEKKKTMVVEESPMILDAALRESSQVIKRSACGGVSPLAVEARIAC